MARYWAVAALSLAECDYVPLDYAAYAREVLVYLDETERAARELKVERALLDEAGLGGRAIEAGNATLASAELLRLTHALNRAAKAIHL